MEEITYLNDAGVLITSTRIELNGQTFAVRNVGSVKVTEPGTPWLAMLILIMAVSMLAGGLYGPGALIGAAAAAWIWQQVRTRRLVVVSGGGEVVALKSTNGKRVEQIRLAIAQAISAR